MRLRNELSARLRDGEDGLMLGQRHALLLDDVMKALFARTLREVGGIPSLALVAVGSYGRGGVALRSDADVRLLLGGRGKQRDAAAKFADALLYPLWDSGFSIGHQVTAVDEMIELAQRDLATATSLLDLRLIAGDGEIYATALDRAWGGIFDEGALGAFLGRLEEEAASRHARFGATVYLLEPDVKSGEGGLRDLDGARWAARARFRVSGIAQHGGPGTWSELVRLGLLLPREANEIASAEEFLWRVRNRLHAHADRRSDRLTFDEQEALALEMGYAPRAHPADAERAAAAEDLMQHYYLHARTVAHARERLFERARPPRKRAKPVETDLGSNLRLFDGQVSIAGVAELAADPALAFRVYAACVRRKVPVLAFAREAIARAAADPAWCEALRANREAAELFVTLVCTVPDVRTRSGSIAAELHEVGLLLAMIPEFKPVTGRVHHDVYHVYTVDVHSVAALDCLRALARGELAVQHPLATRLAAEIAAPRPLFLATLLHDVGKGYPDAAGSRKAHSQTGAELCDVILRRLGVSVEDCAIARALVLEHLTMYHIATRRDLDDGLAIREFCRSVRGREGLRELYLLTVADLSTTSPTAMTSWKARMLEELYLAADAHLAGIKHRAFDEERVAGVRDAAAALWKGSPAYFDEFVSSMPERYLLSNAPDSIATHARVALERNGAPAYAALAPSRHPEVAELCVVAEDHPGLLSHIAAAITAGRLEVLAAQIYSRTIKDASGQPSTEAVDLFWVRDRTEGAAGAGRAMARFARDLVNVCSEKIAPEDLLRERTGSGSPWRERPTPSVATEIVIDDRASPRHTVIEVFAKDRPGLLYTIAHTMHMLGLSIVLSKINTEGSRVVDVFYVNELTGTKVLPGERFRAIREALAAAIGTY